MKTLTYEQALSRAAALCSESEHCSSEIRKKLLLWGLSPTQAKKAIDFLIDEKYHWGKIKISQMLRMLEMDGSEIKDSLDAIPKEEYQEVLQHILEQKNKQLKDADPYIRKGKLIRHALSRGFETHLIIGIADTLVG